MGKHAITADHRQLGFDEFKSDLMAYLEANPDQAANILLTAVREGQSEDVEWLGVVAQQYGGYTTVVY